MHDKAIHDEIEKIKMAAEYIRERINAGGANSGGSETENDSGAPGSVHAANVRNAAESSQTGGKTQTAGCPHVVDPRIGIILGSGLGPLADLLEDPVEIEYASIPGFPAATVAGHAGKLVCGRLGGKSVLAMKGRFHYYEGYDITQVVFHIRVFRALGIADLLVTNAAGGINPDFRPGDLMVITDHIGLFAPSPLRGRNFDEFGERFPDMTNAYDRELVKLAHETAGAAGIPLKEGVYAFTQGPMFETPAEIRALRALGADAVGMSTVPEVIVARHSGMRVLGISCITNMAAGISGSPLSHMEVMDAAKKAEGSFARLVSMITAGWSL